MSLTHRLGRMSGRDPAEQHRTSTPLELLFDLVFVVAFSAVSTQTALLLEKGHWSAAVTGFVLGVFAISWAWVNYSWLASAYDNDDVFFRIATLIEMIGVLVIALGMPPFFRSIDEGRHVDNAIMVSGYVIMRVAAVALWLRAARHDLEHRRACLTYAAAVSAAQVGWVVLIFASLPIGATSWIIAALVGVELVGPLLAERKDGGTPWHPHHIAERYSLLVIITLGEVILGAVLAISAVVDRSGWSVEVVLVASGGTALAFAMWWLYFTVPSGRVLGHHRRRAFGWSYLHIVVFAAVVGTGAGLHAAAIFISGGSHIDATATVLTVALPVFVFELTLVTIYSLLLRTADRYHIWIFSAAALALVSAVVAVGLGASVGAALLLVAASPVLIVVAYETVGYRREEQALKEAEA
ncbi:low temperature requirement protein A [Arthrobacter sp. FW306-04-A]|uniref:low temperature requirement protein A n=1 Tax=Arthrobacter sp. FW306-04-A TaxID=2879619 RepID=UPI0037C0C37C|nr:low temperature requirement protein A [Arthrobacter sp. FW306-04-A]